MDGLGRVINVVPVAAAAWINVKDAGAVTIIGTNASGETYTLTEAKDASGTSAKSPTNANITHYYTTSVSGANPWVEHIITAANTTGAVGGSGVLAVVAFSVDTKALDPGFPYIKVAPTGSGTVFAILHDLDVQRRPSLLAAVGV